MNEQSNKLIKLLQYDNRESKLYMPNEIFNDLRVLHDKGSSHVAFAYSYYYLISWLYRYAKYGIETTIDNKLIKQILGYNPTYPEIDYIIKKNGELDKLGYTTTEKDIPLSWTYENDYLEFYMLSDTEEEIQKLIKSKLSRKYSVKYPVKAFFRSRDSEEDKYLDGTFYDVSNTHLVPFEVFIFCMSKNEIGVLGFYIWSYLRMKNQQHAKGYDVSLDDLSNEVNIARSTMCKYLNKLKEHKMIIYHHNQEYFSFGLSDEEKKANTYTTNEWNKFSYDKIKVDKLKFVSVEEHEKLMKNKDEVSNLLG